MLIEKREALEFVTRVEEPAMIFFFHNQLLSVGGLTWKVVVARALLEVVGIVVSTNTGDVKGDWPQTAAMAAVRLSVPRFWPMSETQTVGSWTGRLVLWSLDVEVPLVDASIPIKVNSIFDFGICYGIETLNTNSGCSASIKVYKEKHGNYARK